MHKDLRHSNISPSKETENFIKNTVLEYVEYFIIHKKGNKKIGHCTRCNNTFEVEGYKHNDSHYCDICRSKLTVKMAGYSRKCLINKAYVLVFEKSKIDKNTVIGKGYFITKKYDEDFTIEDVRYELIAHYIFSLDGCNMIKRDPWFNSSWYETKSIHARNNSLYWDKIQYYIDYDSLDEAIKGTYLQYADYKKFTYDGNNHLLKYLELFSKYPQIEKLNKIGCSNLVRMRLDRQSGTSINFRGKDLWSMLKISKKNFREMQKNRFGPPSMCLIEMYQLKSDSSTLSAKDVEDCSMKYYPDAMKKIIKYTTLDKAYKYLNKQKPKGDYTTHRSVQIQWVDYIEQCVKLKVDLSNKKYLFPSNLEEEHHKTTLKIKLKEDKELDEKIREANKKRDIYNIGYKNLFCRPANSSKELIEEGYELKHCVGGYAQRHAEGGTNILLIRHLDEPDTPFFTLEVDWKGIRQVHGYRNCNPTEEVQEFLDFFKEKILNKRKEVA